mmetsp:Transcript_109047/g.293284  ORF Transcript_109047/g.293284 Transcript_109047/m.293284 type:complete len:307 (-) Transcript_109047:824-1744(-)
MQCCSNYTGRLCRLKRNTSAATLCSQLASDCGLPLNEVHAWPGKEPEASASGPSSGTSSRRPHTSGRTGTLVPSRNPSCAGTHKAGKCPPHGPRSRRSEMRRSPAPAPREVGAKARTRRQNRRCTPTALSKEERSRSTAARGAPSRAAGAAAGAGAGAGAAGAAAAGAGAAVGAATHAAHGAAAAAATTAAHAAAAATAAGLAIVGTAVAHPAGSAHAAGGAGDGAAAAAAAPMSATKKAATLRRQHQRGSCRWAPRPCGAKVEIPPRAPRAATRAPRPKGSPKWVRRHFRPQRRWRSRAGRPACP